MKAKEEHLLQAYLLKGVAHTLRNRHLILFHLQAMLMARVLVQPNFGTEVIRIFQG